MHRHHTDVPAATPPLPSSVCSSSAVFPWLLRARSATHAFLPISSTSATSAVAATSGSTSDLSQPSRNIELWWGLLGCALTECRVGGPILDAHIRPVLQQQRGLHHNQFLSETLTITWRWGLLVCRLLTQCCAPSRADQWSSVHLSSSAPFTWQTQLSQRYPCTSGCGADCVCSHINDLPGAQESSQLLGAAAHHCSQTQCLRDIPLSANELWWQSRCLCSTLYSYHR